MNTPPQPPEPRPDTAAETADRCGVPTDRQPAAVPGADDETRIRPASSSGSVARVHTIGGYAVVKKIGEGGMGSVYLAEDRKLGRKVAIKTMRPELAEDKDNRDRFEREARAAAAVEHENIVPIWGIGEAADGSPFIAMPFLQGETLADRLKRQPVAGLSVLLKVAREVADGLGAAHAKGLIHRDIKPGNIWLDGDLTSKELAQQIRRCKILDFGLARSVDPGDHQLTKSGVILGTPAFMAPEQALGETIDHRADLFSLGVLLYRMATGRMPFRGETAVSVMIALTTETPTPTRALNPNLPLALSDLIDRLLSKDPAGRPPSAPAVSAAVRQIAKALHVKNLSGGAAPVAPVPATPVRTTGQPSDSSTGDRRAPPAPAPRAPQWEEITEAELVSAPPVAGARAAPAPEPAAPKRTRAPKAQARKSARRTRAYGLVAGGVIALFAFVALAVGVRARTADGTLVVAFNDPDVEARLKNGKLVLIGPDGKDQFTVAAAERIKKIPIGSYTIRVEGADGLALDPSEFVLKRGEQVTVRVALDPRAALKKPDPPKKSDSPGVAPPNFEADRKAAEYALSIGGTLTIRTKDTDLKVVADLPRETFRLTVAEFTGNKKVTDAGLAAFAGCEHVTSLDLQGTAVSAAGLVHFRGCKDLQFLAITPRLTDAGLALLDDWKNLRFLWAGGTQLTDAGLAALKGRDRLTDVRLAGTSVSDAGLIHLKECKGLTYLWLVDTQVTARGVADFAKAAPRCTIVWNGGTIEATRK